MRGSAVRGTYNSYVLGAKPHGVTAKRGTWEPAAEPAADLDLALLGPPPDIAASGPSPAERAPLRSLAQHAFDMLNGMLREVRLVECDALPSAMHDTLVAKAGAQLAKIPKPLLAALGDTDPAPFLAEPFGQGLGFANTGNEFIRGCG